MKSRESSHLEYLYAEPELPLPPGHGDSGCLVNTLSQGEEEMAMKYCLRRMSEQSAMLALLLTSYALKLTHHSPGTLLSVLSVRKVVTVKCERKETIPSTFDSSTSHQTTRML